MGYIAPADVWISSSWADHKYRNPPSGEPGTDYATAYGTPVRCAGNGVVVDVNWSPDGGTGRYVAVDLDDGRRVRYLHLAGPWVNEGQRVSRGEGIAASGASGFGSDWGYGPHVHTTLFPNHSYDFGNTLDFQLYVGPDESDNGDDEMNADQAKQLGEIHQALYTTPEQPGGWNGINKVLGEVQHTNAEVHQALYTTPDEPGGWNGISKTLGEVHAATVDPPAGEHGHAWTGAAWLGGAALALFAVVQLIQLVLNVAQ